MKNFKGIGAALVTPFNADSSVNYKSIKAQVRRLINEGIDGFYVCGSTAEAFLLSMDERKACLEAVLEENNNEKFVVAHVGQISTDMAVELAKHAKTAGADAISSISPFYFKFTNAEITGYYKDLMEQSDMPMFVYNFPAFSGFSLTPAILDDLCQDKRLIGVKFTANDFFQLERMKVSHPELTVWNGYDEMLLSGLSAGADGGIGSTYNVLCPAVRGVIDSYRAGDSTKALKYQHVLNGMITEICRYGVFASVKHLMTITGVPAGNCRKPFMPLTEEGKAALTKAYDEFQKGLAAI